MDTMLERALAQATRLVRQRTNRWIHGAAIANGNNTALTVYSVEHGLQAGDKFRLLDDAGAVTGNYTVASTTRHTVTTTTGAAGTVSNVACSLHPFRTVEMHGSGHRDLFLHGVLTPLAQIVKVQVEGEDVAYTATNTDHERLVRLRKNDGTIWDREWTRVGMSPAFSTVRRSSERSVYVEAYVGSRYCPSDIEMCVMSIVAEMVELEGSPKDVQSSSSEGVQRSRLTGEERAKQTVSPDRVLLNWKA